jgi:uncharacterized protein YdiU (UPF0061 family)
MSMQFPFDNSYAQLGTGFSAVQAPVRVSAPALIAVNRPLATELGISLAGEAEMAQIFAGNAVPEGAEPIAQAYAGHQFGGFSPQLGDGRAVLLGEVVDVHGQRRDIQLKGSGPTPFSRGGDGRSWLGPTLREYVVSEAMHAMGIPTTRALAAAITGDSVYRQQGALPGAVLTRIAASHLRVGTFQFFAARHNTAALRQLFDYTVARHYPDAETPGDLLRAVIRRQAVLVAQWMGVGFIHGVMNTDNMTISGETIDYGPCAFLDVYDPKMVFSSIDQNGRYAYGNQPQIAQWNLARLAETLLDLINPDDSDAAVRMASEVINGFPEAYQDAWLEGMRQKLGLEREEDTDMELATDLFSVMEGQNVDFTQLFRSLSDVAAGQAEAARSLFDDPAVFDGWLAAYRERLQREPGAAQERSAAMNRVNPVYIPRNHMVETALESAGKGDLAPFERLVEVLANPFEARTGLEVYALGAPSGFGAYTTYCGT